MMFAEISLLRRERYTVKRKKVCMLALMLALSMLIILLSGCGKTQNPMATITLSDGRQILIYLYPDKAPNTVANFIKLANSGFYDGLKFHRVVNSTLIQGGDPAGNGTGGPGYFIEGEFSANGYSKNDVSFTGGTVGMARFSNSQGEEDYNTAGSQFFITVINKSSSYDGYYAGFGRVFSGLNIVTELSQVDAHDDDTPKKDIIIQSIRVETYGKDYGEPKTIEAY